MAQIFLRPQSNPTQEQAYQAVTLYFGEVLDHQQQSGFSVIRNQVPDLNYPYHGLSFWIENLTFNDSDERYTVIDNINFASPLTDTPIMDDDLERVDPYGTAGRFTVNFKDSAFDAMTIGVKPDDFDTLPYKYWHKDTDGSYKAGTRGEIFQPLTQYYRSKKTYKMQYNVVGSGLIDFSFGFTTMFGSGTTGYGAVFSTPDDLSYSINWNTDSWNWGLPRISIARYNNFYGESYGVSATTSYKGPYVEVFPVAFSIPAGRTISGYGGDYTLTKTTQYYGTIIIKYDEYSIPRNAFIQALEEKCWASPSHPHGDYGPDTPAYGGKGKAPVSRDNPMQSITKAKTGGILSSIQDVTSKAGVVIYKMTENQFSLFLERFCEKSIEGLARGWSIGATDNYQLLPGIDTIYNYLTKDAGNILFIKNSAVSFPATPTQNFSIMKVGSADINLIQAQIVTEWYKDGNTTVSLVNNNYTKVNDFTDLEPYASAELYFPTASTISVPPSYLAESTLDIRYGFNLLDSSSTFVVNINTDRGGYVQLASTGQCCSDANTLIAQKEVISSGNQSIAPLISKGVSTIATGGLTAPEMVTTAMGAAATAVPSSQQMIVSNIPSGGSTSPYNDCIIGGRRSAFLTITKSERLSSGEEGFDAGRMDVQGKFSNFFISSVSNIGNDNFISVLRVKMDMASGMTKAEYDKIIALLHEGVWI